MVRRARVSTEPNVQWVLDKLRTHEDTLKNTDFYREFLSLYYLYFNEQVQNNPELERQVGKAIRVTAKHFRNNFEDKNLYKYDELYEYRRTNGEPKHTE